MVTLSLFFLDRFYTDICCTLPAPAPWWPFCVPRCGQCLWCLHLWLQCHESVWLFHPYWPVPQRSATGRLFMYGYILYVWLHFHIWLHSFGMVTLPILDKHMVTLYNVSAADRCGYSRSVNQYVNCLYIYIFPIISYMCLLCMVTLCMYDYTWTRRYNKLIFTGCVLNTTGT